MTKAIETSGLGKVYGLTVVVAVLDLRVEPGEVYGFLGPNGARKTTTIRMPLALQRGRSPESLGARPSSRVGLGRGHRRVGYLPGDPELCPRLTGWQHLEWFAEFGGGSSLDRTGSSPSASSWC